jgi:hypothetical protein
MNLQQNLFLEQARSAFEVFGLLRRQEDIHHCHALHYLQMATELLGKAKAWKRGSVPATHKALNLLTRTLK